ncbi:Chromodomain-helicase-DNA-binding protein [Wickerhamomyces ciferrii]|uniref:Chromodomain-helicase-DNA-binding protein n=1 Tax=Wickerhamomyces ciferrii (strain ATCC 14091 / BCRC 22168 / CBS 111 / JCM 3599 / NBRC 0793 / NRRL Y-1031 F-60-10) TaxID=1206466 RepID=K0KVX8_WICCF|nr:Chromodomain-helicase-DNA-binding protein [Wickerhamomyces ciferrii]CCH45263.1 Chromodomain-helicase-DNA-binding protein [Wickerhamomyces ciferrii]
MFTDKKLKEYNDREERFKQAIEEAQNNKTASINSIANKYRVSRTTLSRRIHGFKNTRTSHEKQQKFTNDEELIIIERINQLLKKSSQIPSKKEILVICEDLLKTKYMDKQQQPENESFFKVGKNWIDRFLERHNDKLMINEKTSLCEYYKYEFLQRKKLRSNRDFKSEDDESSSNSPSIHDADELQHPSTLSHHPYQQQQYPQQPLQYQQQFLPQQHRPLFPPPPTGDYIYPSNMNQENQMNIPNQFQIPGLIPQASFNTSDLSNWNAGNINSVPMKPSNKLPYSQSMNFQYPQPQQTQPQQPQQQQQTPSTPSQAQAQGNRNTGFGPNSILNNHGVHLNGNAVVNIYPEGGPIPNQQQQQVQPQTTNSSTPSNTNNVNPYYQTTPIGPPSGLNNYTAHNQQNPLLPPHTNMVIPTPQQQQAQQLQQQDSNQSQQSSVQDQEQKPKLEHPSNIDLMEFFNSEQRFFFENARIKLLSELEKSQPDLNFVTKLINLSFENFGKELNTNNAVNAAAVNGGFIPSYH